MKVFEGVVSVITERLGVSKEGITEETSIKGDLGADSLDVVELIMELEDKFDIEIPDEEAEQIQTIGDAVDFIKKNNN